MDLAEVVGHGHQPLAVGAAQGVDVGAVRALQPDAWGERARDSARGGGLIHLFNCCFSEICSHRLDTLA